MNPASIFPLTTAVLTGTMLTFAAPGAAEKPEPIAAKPLTERHAFTDDVSMQITQDLDGLAAQEVEIDDASHLVVVEFTI